MKRFKSRTLLKSVFLSAPLFGLLFAGGCAGIQQGGNGGGIQQDCGTTAVSAVAAVSILRFSKFEMSGNKRDLQPGYRARLKHRGELDQRRGGKPFARNAPAHAQWQRLSKISEQFCTARQ